MKPEKLQDAIGLVGDDLIEEAEFHTQRKTKSKWWMALTAACLTLAIIAAAIFLPEKNIVKLPNDGGSGNKNQTVQNPVNLSAYALNEAVYPQTVAYPEYEDFSDEGYNKFEKEEKEWRRSRNELNKGYSDTMNIDLFFKETFKSFLSNSEGDNMIYSPLNIYFALGMLAELTDGNSRKQILDAVGTKSIEALRNDANALWRANYYDDGRTTSILASSLWLNQGINFKENTLKRITDTYYSSSYRGEMGSEKFNGALRTWLNNQTKNLLSEQINTLEMTPETVLALASTIYFKASWEEEFIEKFTKKDTFHSKNGDITCDFMVDNYSGNYFYGKNFKAVKRYLRGSGSMYFILPDKGTDVDELISGGEVTEFICTGDMWKNIDSALINFSVPKFDVSGQLNLSNLLPKIGIKDVFDPKVSDFSPMTEDVGEIFVSSATHGARVLIDEKGCIGAAYTAIMTDGTSMPSERLEFTLDRPFIFAVTSTTGDPLFAGVVNRP